MICSKRSVVSSTLTQGCSEELLRGGLDVLLHIAEAEETDGGTGLGRIEQRREQRTRQAAQSQDLHALTHYLEGEVRVQSVSGISDSVCFQSYTARQEKGSDSSLEE